jgi:hypothetical protein
VSAATRLPSPASTSSICIRSVRSTRSRRRRKYAKHDVDPLLVAGDRITARHVPVDVLGEERPDRRLLATCVEGSLSLVQPAEELYNLGSLHDTSYGSRRGSRQDRALVPSACQ